MTFPDLPAADHAARRDRLRVELERAELDAILITTVVNVRWLTGFTGTNAQIIVTRDPRSDLIFTDGRYRDQIADEAPDVTVDIQRSRVLERTVEHLAGVGAVRLGFEADTLDWRTAEALRERATSRDLQAVPADRLVEGLRRTKDAHEIAALERACALTDAAVADLLSWVQPGMSERDVAVRFEREMVDLGASGPAFETIVASGPNSAVPHHRPTRRLLERGDLLKIDAGAVYAGYHADMTRTVALGNVEDELRSVHDLVREAQAAAVEAVSAGVTCGEVDATCRELIAAGGYGSDFLHGTGHGVGLEVHEAPMLASGSQIALGAGFTVTVEPGIYLSGRGGVRIEDTVVVRDGEPAHVLTTTPRELIVL